MKTKIYILHSLTILLLLLWIPVALDKIVDFDTFEAGIRRQPLNEALARLLVYGLPVLEVLVVVMLIAHYQKRNVQTVQPRASRPAVPAEPDISSVQTRVISTRDEETSIGSRAARSAGWARRALANPYALSTVLMTAFTGYIAAALLGAWEQLPCGCGSVIAGMDWHQHFWFNLFFLTVSIVAWWLDTALQRRFPKKKALFQAIRP